MRTIWLVIKHEITKTLRQRSFWVMTILMPAFLLGIQAYAVIDDNELTESGTATGEATTETDAAPETTRIGLVDEAGLIQEFPADFPPDYFIPYGDHDTALSAIEGGELDQYVLIPADYLASGEITVYDKEFQLLMDGADGVGFDGSGETLLRYLIDYNLTGDPTIILALQNPTPGWLATPHIMNPPDPSETDDRALGILVASMLPYIYYFLLLIGSSYLMRSVVAEKENRTAEVLLTTLRPRELMLGKILGLGVVTLIQMVVWVGGGALALDRGADILNVSEFTFPAGFFIWALVFLLLGYLLYGGIMAAAGALAPTAREGGQVTWLLIIPLMPTLMFGQQFLDNPDSTISLVLSMFPFSAPSAMVTRLAVSEVPTWQLMVSLVGVILTTWLFIWLAARFFKSGNLLSDAAFNWKRLFTEWR